MAAWTILAMPPVLWRTPWRGLHFEHVQTTISGHPGSLRGDTVWAAASGSIAIGWEWVQVVRNVVALADPMSITSNLIPVDGQDDRAVPECRRLVLLNNLVHAAPWQASVCERVRNATRRHIRPRQTELGVTHANARRRPDTATNLETPF